MRGFSALSASALALAVLATQPSAIAAQPCKVGDREFDGLAHYLVGHQWLSGSIYADCVGGQATCFEDDAIADTVDKVVPCEEAANEARQRRLGLFIEGRNAWPERVVCYQFQNEFSPEAHGMWQGAFQEYLDKAQIAFVQRDECRSRYGDNTRICNNCESVLTIKTDEDGCWAHVGFNEGAEWQPKLNIGGGCEFYGTFVHEMGHVLGMLHEHQHPDREVIMLRDKLRVASSNYMMDRNARTSSYDRQSVMHYDGEEMCVPKDAGIHYCDVEETEANGCVMPNEDACDRSQQSSFGNHGTLTDRDVEALRIMYENENANPNSPGAPPPPPPPPPSEPESTPEPATPEPLAPEPVAPEPVAPEPATPEPVAPGGGGFKYAGDGPNGDAMTQWCNWNCPAFCPGDICQPA